MVILNKHYLRGLCNVAPSFKTLCIECRWPRIFFSYIKASKLNERTLRLPTATKMTRGGKMKAAFLVGGDFHAQSRVSLAVLSLRKTKVYSE